MTPLWTSAQAEEATQGSSSAAWSATGVSIDSRTVAKGDLFIAIKGEHMDGHDFAAQALKQGATAAMVHQTIPGNPSPLLQVSDTTRALEDLGRYARNRSKAAIAAVTGSVGKTSTKEMLRIALSSLGETYATEGNLNNHYGLPLSLTRMPQPSRYGVFELGMNHAGELTPLSTLARPHVAIITTIESVHLEFFASVEDIARAKAEIFCGLEPGGTAILPRDNPHFPVLLAEAKRHGVSSILTFGQHKEADSRLLDYAEKDGTAHITASLCGKELPVTLGVLGKHMAINALAVLAAVQALKGDVKKAATALASCENAKGRGKVQQLTLHSGGSFTLIDDSYNASPASVTAALATLRSRAGTARTIAVLGDMFELGNTAPEQHRSLAKIILQEGIDKTFTCGQLMQHLHDALPGAKQGAHAPTPAALAEQLKKELAAGDFVLLKGSRGMRMETIIQYLKEPSDAVSSAATTL